VAATHLCGLKPERAGCATVERDRRRYPSLLDSPRPAQGLGLGVARHGVLAAGPVRRQPAHPL